MPATDTIAQLNASLTGRYTVEREIGAGGMATVYLAHDLKHDRRVALKVMHADVAAGIGSGPGSERFLREIRLCARLTHPHILPLLDSGFANGFPYYLMPYVSGESVRQRLDRVGRLPIDEAITIAREVGDALDYSHAAGVLHRDVKPGNILLLGAHAVVLDFGVARAINAASDTSPDVTSVGLTLGTPAYMSPEQAAGEQNLDGRSDLYSLAVVLFEALAGEQPFQGKNVQTVIAKRFTTTPPPLDSVRDDVPPHVARAVERALALEPGDRFATAGEFAQALLAPAKGTAPARRPPPSPPSIAVIPFANVGDDAANAYLSDGITDEMISTLSRLRTLRVAARTSSYALRDTHEEITAIGRRLNVDTVLEGSVQRSKQRVRISTRLLSVKDGFQFWSEQFDRQLDDIFAIQDEISGAVVRTLKATILDGTGAHARVTRETNVAAYELYLKGSLFLTRRTESDLARAAEYFTAAIAGDPDYAPSHAGLADTYAVMGAYGVRAPLDVMPLARASAQRALSLDPSLAEAHATLALVLGTFEHDWAEAAEEFRRAVTLGPSSSLVRQRHAASLLSPRGRHAEAIVESDRALALDPLSPAVSATCGIIRSLAGEHDAAIAHHELTLELDSHFGVGYFFLGQALLGAGRTADAVRAVERAIALTGGTPEMQAVLANARASGGDAAGARALLAELLRQRETRYVSASLIAQVHIGLGNKEDALDWLERAHAENDLELTYLGVRSVYDGLRDSPRFRRILEDTGARS